MDFATIHSVSRFAGPSEVKKHRPATPRGHRNVGASGAKVQALDQNPQAVPQASGVLGWF